MEFSALQSLMSEGLATYSVHRSHLGLAVSRRAFAVFAVSPSPYSFARKGFILSCTFCSL